MFDLGNTLIIQGNPLGRIQTFPETHEVLQILNKQYKLALITNVYPTTTVEHVHEVLREANIHEYFDVITVSSGVGMSKPTAQIFEDTLRQLDVTPDEAIMVGNTISTDIFGGNCVGMTTVLIQHHEEYQPMDWEQPDHTIHSLNEILKFLANK
ncbi:MAG: HAD family hydrolase [Candidatus Bathyarchaeota archaeon]|nr:HAD family hydrolase [Candidatus Bathyarchaeota archaeon]